MRNSTQCLLLMPWLLLLLPTIVHAQSASNNAVIQLASATSVSNHFQNETAAATKSIPRQVWKTLRDAGWKVQLAEFVVDAAPSLRGVRPPGWPRHLTWDNSDAVHLPTDRLLVIAEKRKNRAGEVVASSRVAGVLRHEIGHAFDMAASNTSAPASSTPQFIRAYNYDADRISADDKRKFSYYLQNGAVGRQEAFAEAFAIILGGGSSEIDAKHFEHRFPNVLAYTRNVIEQPNHAESTSQPQRVSTAPIYRRRLLRRR